MAAHSTIEFKKPLWQTIALLSLGFWLSGTLLLDGVIMPSLYAAGMMTQPGFASAGYMIFGMFNRIELLCAALVLTGILALVKLHQVQGKWITPAIVISVFLLALTSIETYGLTPQLSALVMQLNWLEPLQQSAAEMTQMQSGYWALELLKLTGGAILLTWLYRDRGESVAQ